MSILIDWITTIVASLTLNRISRLLYSLFYSDYLLILIYLIFVSIGILDLGFSYIVNKLSLG